jgi:hypothetical protein
VSIVQTTTSPHQWTFTFTAANASGQSASSSRTLTQLAATTAPAPSSALLQSPNWSGYVLPSSTLITEVAGTWTVPTLNCSATPNASVGVWVGIGGWGWQTGGSSGALLQTGIGSVCTNGVQTNTGWFEEYPSNPNHSYPFTGFPVSAGDTIKATVYEGAGSSVWVTKVDDVTKGLTGVMVTGGAWGVAVDSGNGSFPQQGSAAGLSYSGGYTAEWIVEDNGVGADNSLAPFANFGTVVFTNLTTSASSWSLATSYPVEIVQGGQALSTPSAPVGSGFSVSYTG